VVERLRRGFRVWAALARAGLRTELQYRANFVFGVLGGLALQGAGLAFIGTILARFATIGGWTLPEIMLLYGMRLTSHSLWTLPCSNLMVSDYAVREAEFDRYLTRPVNPFVQLITRRLPVTTISDLLGGVAILSVGLATAPVHWSVPKIVLLVFALVGGALIELSCQTVGAGLAFRMLSTVSLKITIDNVFNTFGNYPAKIFGPAARWLLTCAFPLAFASYFPATVLLGRTGELWIPVWLACCSPAVGILLFAAAYRFWHRQLNHYASSGN
jgi:viologen exporter family transport system permease protein